MTSNNKLGEKIRKLRMDLALSRTQLADLLDVDVSTMCRYENGARRPGLSTVSKFIKLAELKGFELDIDYFR